MLLEVTPGVLVATSRRDTTTSTVVVSPGTGDGHDVLLIDPAWEVDELESLADDLDARGLRVVAGFSTHAHFDHMLWHPRFGAPPRWASAATAVEAQTSRAATLEELGDWPDDLIPLVGQVAAVPADHVPWPGQRAEVIVHGAHATGSAAIWLPETRILIAGDMLSDVEPPLPAEDDEDLSAYRAGLDILAPYVERAAWLIPGHGHPTDEPSARLAADRRRLDSLGGHASD